MLGLRAAREHAPVPLAVDPLNAAEAAAAGEAGAPGSVSNPSSAPGLPPPLAGPAASRQRQRDVAALLDGGGDRGLGAGGPGEEEGEEEEEEEEEEEDVLLDWRAKAF